MNLFFDYYQDNSDHFSTHSQWYDYGISSFMNMCYFLKYPREVLDVNDIRQMFRYNEYPKDTVLVQPGEKTANLYFIITGSIKIYHLDHDNNERNNILLNEGNVFTSMDNFLYEGETVMFMKSMEKLRVLEATKASIFKDWGTEKNVLIKDVVSRIVAKRLTFHLKLDRILRMSSLEKVEELYKVFPAILDSFYEKEVASLLDISRENFSRVKRKLLKQHNGNGD